jgi:hypothetical protein
MKNRYGNEYRFEKINDNTYTIKGDLDYWRYGGKEGADGIDENDLGFVDPSGGPFIAPGYMIEGRKIKRISSVEGELYFEVE